MELWLDDKATLCDYTWSVVMGGPTAAEVQYPARSGELTPGEYHVTYDQQVKDHYFWAMYRAESCNDLVVKWVRGNCPPGNRRWQHKKHT